MSVQSNFKTTTTQSLGNSTTTDLDIYLDTLPNSSTGYLVLDPEGSNYELIYYESKDAATGKVTCPAANGRALSLIATTRTTVAGNVKSHGPGTVVIMAPDHLTLSNLELNKLDIDGGNVSDSFDAEDSNNEWRIRNNAGVMELRDKNTATVTLADLAAAAGADQKVKVSIDDATSGLVEDKFVAGTNTTVTTNNPGGNETFQYNAAGTLASIVTDVTATSAEINQALEGINGTVDATALNIVTGGAASNADSEHTHSGLATISATAGEDLALGDPVYVKGLTVASVAPDKDNYVDSSNPATVYNGTTLDVQITAGGTIIRSLIHFDISAYPASVHKAFLRIVSTNQTNINAADRAIKVFDLNGSFDEAAVTWNIQPGINAESAVAPYDTRHQYPAGGGCVIDITDIYNDNWSVDNYGLSIRWDDESLPAATYRFPPGSRTNGTAAYRPTLILIYEDSDYLKAFKPSSNAQAAGVKGIVTTAATTGNTAVIALDGVVKGLAGLTPHQLLKANNAGSLVAATNALDAQFQALSATELKILDKRKEYASDILGISATIYDQDKSIVQIPGGLISDNATATAASSSVEINPLGYAISTPTDNGITSRSVGISAIDIL